MRAHWTQNEEIINDVITAIRDRFRKVGNIPEEGEEILSKIRTEVKPHGCGDYLFVQIPFTQGDENDNLLLGNLGHQLQWADRAIASFEGDDLLSTKDGWTIRIVHDADCLAIVNEDGNMFLQVIVDDITY